MRPNLNGRQSTVMGTIKNWIKDRFSAQEPAPTPNLHGTGIRPKPRRAKPRPQEPDYSPDFVESDPALRGHVESLGPGKNVLIRKRFVREDTGTHETLKILDDSIVDSGEETGIDPYNTGGFDRSKKWDQRFRK